jgi:hypothetical protein
MTTEKLSDKVIGRPGGRISAGKKPRRARILNMFKKFIAFFSRMTTKRLLDLFLLIGLALWILSGVFLYIAPYIGGLLFILGLVAFGFMGLIIIVRKEFPWIIPIKGWLAVVEGVIFLVFGWVAAIGMIWILLIRR